MIDWVGVGLLMKGTYSYLFELESQRDFHKRKMKDAGAGEDLRRNSTAG